jgi:hypothetical protein
MVLVRTLLTLALLIVIEMALLGVCAVSEVITFVIITRCREIAAVPITLFPITKCRSSKLKPTTINVLADTAVNKDISTVPSRRCTRLN